MKFFAFLMVDFFENLQKNGFSDLFLSFMFTLANLFDSLLRKVNNEALMDGLKASQIVRLLTADIFTETAMPYTTSCNFSLKQTVRDFLTVSFQTPSI